MIGEREVRSWLTQTKMELISKHFGAPPASLPRGDAKSLMKQLATTADTQGISFKSKVLQREYFADKFERRGLLIYSIFAHAFDSNSNDSDSQALRRVFESQLLNKPTIAVSSFGGGPGTDSAGDLSASICSNK